MEHSRRHEPTRLEAFSDAVFAFALTLLVVALDVPKKNYADLMNLVGGFLPFAACFAWPAHGLYGRRAARQRALLESPLPDPGAPSPALEEAASREPAGSV